MLVYIHLAVPFATAYVNRSVNVNGNAPGVVMLLIVNQQQLNRMAVKVVFVNVHEMLMNVREIAAIRD